MSNPNALFLLADHVKLSLLERQRAKTLNLESDSQDGHISRSLDQLREGVEGLQKEQKRLEEAGEEDKAANIADSLPTLQKQLDDLTSQFHGFSTPSSSSTLTHPNDPALAEDFAHATSTTAPASSAAASGSSSAAAQPQKKSLRASTANPLSPAPAAGGSTKTVRFRDASPPASPSAPAASGLDADLEAQRSSSELFGRPYRDEPDAPEGYRDAAAAMEDNVQIHEYHSRVLAQQDEHLDRLGESIGRQRELSMRIGDELDSQVAMLDESEGLVDRHQSRLDRARRQVGRIARKHGGEIRQMTYIVVLIVILILLIAVLK